MEGEDRTKTGRQQNREEVREGKRTNEQGGWRREEGGGRHTPASELQEGIPERNL
jgi:hypothetical protein